MLPRCYPKRKSRKVSDAAAERERGDEGLQIRIHDILVFEEHSVRFVTVIPQIDTLGTDRLNCRVVLLAKLPRPLDQIVPRRQQDAGSVTKTISERSANCLRCIVRVSESQSREVVPQPG